MKTLPEQQGGHPVDVTEQEWEKELEHLTAIVACPEHRAWSTLTDLYHVRSVLGTVRVRFEREGPKLANCLRAVVQAQVNVNMILERVDDRQTRSPK